MESLSQDSLVYTYQSYNTGNEDYMQRGEQFGITHAGCTAWKTPTLSLTTLIANSKTSLPSDAIDRMEEIIRRQQIQLKRMMK